MCPDNKTTTNGHDAASQPNFFHGLSSCTVWMTTNRIFIPYQRPTLNGMIMMQRCTGSWQFV